MFGVDRFGGVLVAEDASGVEDVENVVGDVPECHLLQEGDEFGI